MDNNLEYLTRKFLIKEKLLILSINQKCNLKCTYCRGEMEDWYDRLAQNSTNKNLPIGNWPQLITICKSNNVGEILLTGGEPLLYSHLNDLSVFLNDNGIRFSMHTNGLTKKGMDFLRFLTKEKLYANFHISSELNEDLQKTIRGCKLPLDFIGEAIKCGFRVELKVVLHQKLIPLLPKINDMIYQWKALGISSIRFQPVVPIDHLEMKDLLLNENAIPVLDKIIDLINCDDIIKPFIRNTAESIEGIKSQIYLSPFRFYLADKCNIIDKLIFLDTDLKYQNCKTLWKKNESDDCRKVFDMVCCGYQS